jgi:glycosyltransferase involved in cell wall biosynthesis
MSLTLIVPFFNESERWLEDYWHDASSLKDVQWIFVNDGSSDDTKTLIEEFCRGHSNAFAIHLLQNSGKAEAVRVGMLSAFENPSSDLQGIGFVDCDGAFTVNEIERVSQIFRLKLREHNGFDALWTARIALAGRSVTRSNFRHYVGRVIATIISSNLKDLPYDTQSGFKLFVASQSLKQHLSSPFKTRWFFDVELLLRWNLWNSKPMKIWEEPLLAWNDVAGSKVKLRQTASIIKELLIINKLKKSISRSKKLS